MFFRFMSDTKNCLVFIAAYAAAKQDIRSRVELAQKREIIDWYAQGRVGRNTKQICVEVFIYVFFHRPLVLRLVVLASAYEPQVSLHRLLAVSEVLLCKEVNLVLGNLRQVFLTCRYHRTYGLEALTSSHLFRFERRRTLHFLSQVQSVAIAALRRCRTVCTKQHLCTTVLSVLSGFTQCARHMVDTRNSILLLP